MQALNSEHLHLEPGTSSLLRLVRLEQQRKLWPIWIVAQNRPLQDRRLFADLADGHGGLELERAYEREEERFYSVFGVGQFESGSMPDLRTPASGTRVTHSTREKRYAMHAQGPPRKVST